AKKQLRSNPPASPFADAGSNRTRSVSPTAVAARRAESMLPAWLSNPANRDAGNAPAMISADVPSPHPTSATSAPPRRVSITPSIAGSHSPRIDERYSGPKNRSVEQNRQALWSPHGT